MGKPIKQAKVITITDTDKYELDPNTGRVVSKQDFRSILLSKVSENGLKLADAIIQAAGEGEVAAIKKILEELDKQVVDESLPISKEQLDAIILTRAERIQGKLAGATGRRESSLGVE